jgi:hypothetical protein
MLRRSIVHLDANALFATVGQAANAPTAWRRFFVDFSQKRF